MVYQLRMKALFTALITQFAEVIRGVKSRNEEE